MAKIKLDLTDPETKATVDAWLDGQTYSLVFTAPDVMEEETAEEEAAPEEEPESPPPMNAKKSKNPAMNNLMAAKYGQP